jgi:hypothetical protein
MRATLPLGFLLLGLGCDEGVEEAFARGSQPAYVAEAPITRRLTHDQYVHTLDDLFGEGLVLPASLEPDSRVSGLIAVGASVTSISALGVERYESAAFDIVEQVFADPERRARLGSCDPGEGRDDACAAELLATIGPAAWRRPLTEEESARLVEIAGSAAEALGSFDEGFGYALAALLQSPWFLFRPEVGAVGEDGVRRYDAWELAVRLSYFLWDGPPDEALRAAAQSGALLEEEELAAQVDRLLADDRTRRGLRAFVADMLQLAELDTLTKDPTIFVYMSAGLGNAAREQTLLDAESIVLDDDADFRRLLTSTDTHLDRTLAALYDVPAPEREGFGATTLPTSGGRRGFLGQASFLALQSHATSTSVTLRGKFIREVLLCQNLPTPPAGLNTSIPEASEELRTMRERVARHLEEPSCAACHQVMDPIGLGLENFDGVGRWREEENGATIDPGGELDGEAFADAWALAGTLAAHEDFGPCVNRTVYRYATGRTDAEAEAALVDWHADGLKESGYRLQFLMRDVALGPAFRVVGEVL